MQMSFDIQQPTAKACKRYCVAPTVASIAVLSTLFWCAKFTAAFEPAAEQPPTASATGPAPTTAANATAPSSPPPPPLDPLTPEAQAAVDQMQRDLPTDSEARAMLTAILSGSQLQSGEGWFATAISKTRFAPTAMISQFDTDKNGSISRSEFHGSDTDFEVLDRDHSGEIVAADLVWPEHALQATPGFRMFMMLDRDGNGALTREELEQAFQYWDRDAAGFATLDDLRAAYPSPPPTTSEKPAPRKDAPSRSTLVLGLARQEIGSQQPGPDLESVAPDFTLPVLGTDRPNSANSITLSQLTQQKPVVLVFGNFTCGPFRSQAGNVLKLTKRYGDRVSFVMVYVREAHPRDGWWMESNQRVRIDIPQPTTIAERRTVAAQCRESLQIDFPFVVDEIDDRVGAMYSGMPSRLYLIDTAGKVVYKSGRGPFGFKPAELEQSIVWLLNSPAVPANSK